MYKNVSTDLDFCKREQEVLDFWKENRIFQKTMDMHEGAEQFTFFDGPPTANGKPHIGHLLTRSMKDLFPRYKFMKGYHVLRKAGWDTHGLPVELEVEKLLGLDGKEQIEEYGIKPFIEQCKESVWKYKGEWEQMSDRIGYWADMENPYVTYEDNYIESVWWSLKQLWDKGLLYKGHKIVPYCPRCGTALSSHEVAQGYKDVTETSIFVKFKVEGEEDTYFIAWTTTPWTLPSNVGLCVNPEENYVKVQCGNEKYIVAEALYQSLLGEDAEVLDKKLGKELVGIHYEPLFSFQRDYAQGRDGWRIVADGYVTLTEGSGIVHIAPAFGEDDYRVGQDYELPFLQMVDAHGSFLKGTPWEGTFAKDADRPIIDELNERGLLFREMENTHSYPFCWRCDTPLLYYARSSWFIKMTAVREQLMKNNRSVNWLPETIKEGRMGNFLENVIDWGLSRERYWGTPLPIWECECGHRECIGSRQELMEKGVNVDPEMELHKPMIDEVKLTCPVCGKPMTRVKDVIDCWYDSGSMPFAQWHYPFENKEEFEKNFPAQFISEAIDQTRGWFYTLLAISTCLFDRAPFENCIVLGHVQDKDGQKMSKHKGNVVDPWSVLNKQGADAVRWYFYTGSSPWLPSRFSGEAVSEYQRKFMGTLWNTYAFYVLYAEIDQYNPYDEKNIKPEYSVMDKWVLSKLHSLVKQVTKELDEYHVTEAGRAIQEFTDELSNWYVRRCRERYWGSEMTGDKSAAYATLFEVLETMSRLIAPFVPFMAEQIYQNIVRSVHPGAPESVHFCEYPKAQEDRIDQELEEEMDFVLRVVVLGRSCRNAAAVKNRQPLKRMLIQGERTPGALYRDIIREELNVKEIEIIDDASEYVGYKVKPQLKTIGPKYGKLLPKINAYLQQADGTKIVNAVEQDGYFATEIDGQEVKFLKDDLLIETKQVEGFSAASERELSVVLDLHLTDALIEEGYCREVVSKIQTMRKDADFNVTDHIRVGYQAEGALLEALKKNEREIAKEVLADEIAQGEFEAEAKKEWNINGHKATLCISRV